MNQLANILEGAGLLAAGAALCFLILWWKERNLKKASALEAEAVLSKARNEAELILRDARLSANEEAKKLREQLEQSFAARRAERAELERRLSEREGLINSQLQRIVEGEKNLQEQKAAVRERATAVESQQRQLADLTRWRLLPVFKHRCIRSRLKSVIQANFS